jgi:hypothetical protein
MKRTLGEPKPTTAEERRTHKMLKGWPIQTAAIFGLYCKKKHPNTPVTLFTDAWLQWRLVTSVDTAPE